MIDAVNGAEFDRLLRKKWQAAFGLAQRSAKKFVYATRRKRRARQILFLVYWIGAALGASCLFFAVLSLPVLAALAFAAGVIVRWLAYRVTLSRLRVTREITKFAAFDYDGARIQCSFNEPALLRAVDPWTGRWLSALLAWAICGHWLGGRQVNFSVLPPVTLHVPLVAYIVACGLIALPYAFFILFMLVPGWRKRWSRQAKAVIEARAAAALVGVEGPIELDGLEVGAAALWQQLDAEDVGTYREAIRRWLREHAAEAVIAPESTQALLATVTELARLDMGHLGGAITIYREVEKRFAEAGMLTRVLRDEVLVQRCRRLEQELQRMRVMLYGRNWEAGDKRSKQLQRELEEFAEELFGRVRLLANSTTHVSLAACADPYRLLGVDANAPLSSIKRVRQKLALIYHPDTGGETCNAVKMAELNAAYDALVRVRSGSRGAG
jgi:hypothetical protein